MVQTDQSPVSTNRSVLQPRARNPHQYSASRIAGIYFIVGILWIGLSDWTLASFGGLTTTGLWVAFGKGLGFLLLSTGLLFFLCRRENRSFSRTMDLLHAVVEGTTDAVFVKDSEGRYQLVNEAAAGFIGRPVAEIIGRDDSELFGGVDAERLMANDRAIMASGAVVTQDETLTSGGVTRVYQATKAPYLDEKGKVVGLVGISRNITDRALVESALRETDARLREAQRIAKLGSWSWNPVTNQVWWSDAEFELFGASPRDVTPSFEAFLAFLHPDDREKAIARVMLMQDGAQEFANDLRVIRQDGKCVWIHSQAFATRDTEGNLVRVEGTDQDITDRKRAEEAREVATQRLAKFASQLPGAIYLYRLGTDDKSCVPYASDKIESILGLRQEPLNSGAVEAFAKAHIEDHEAIMESIRKSAQDLTPLSKEFRVVDDDGAIRWISFDAVPEREPDGATLWHGYMKEVTEAHEAAMELEEAKVRLEEAQALARIGSWSIDVLTNTQHWSKQMFKIFGYDSAATQASCEIVLESLHPEDAALLDAAQRKAAVDGTPFSIIARVQQSPSDVRFVRCEGRSRRDSLGKIVGLYGTSADVTAETEREQELLAARMQADAANRAKSEFLANMSHEIRTPLTAILGFTEVLREDEKFAAPPHWIHNLDTIAKAGKHLLSIINDILDLSKIEADKATLEFIETPLIEVLSEVERLLRPSALGKGVLLETKLSTPLPDRIMCDPTRLRQILMNLVGNAVKFTEAGSIVINASVTSSNESDSLIIDIEDTGRGINAEQSQSMFQAFEQADKTVSRKHGGTGLGLTISRRLAVIMGGDVTLVRTELGKGSCFRLTLPLIPVLGSVFVNTIQTKTISAGNVTPERVSIDGRILLAEDGLDNQRLIAFLLKKSGATVDVAGDGKVALKMMDEAIASQQPYDLLITDMQMPVMDGYLLVETLRSRGVKLPILALTAHAQPEDRQKCMDSGCDDYLSKPIDKHSLLDFCSKWIGVQR
jgi:PAS domain S-box-containing protein